MKSKCIAFALIVPCIILFMLITVMPSYALQEAEVIQLSQRGAADIHQYIPPDEGSDEPEREVKEVIKEGAERLPQEEKEEGFINIEPPIDPNEEPFIDFNAIDTEASPEEPSTRR